MSKRRRSLSPCPSHASACAPVSPMYSPSSPYPPASPAYSPDGGGGVSRAEVMATQVLHSNEIRRMEEAHEGEITRLNAEHGASLEAAGCRARKAQSRNDRALAEVARLRRQMDDRYEINEADQRELRREVDRLKAANKKVATARTTLSKMKVKMYERTIDEQRADIGRLEEKAKRTAALKAQNAKLQGDMDKERQVARAEKQKCTQLQSLLDAARNAVSDEHKSHVATLGTYELARATAEGEKDRLQGELDRLKAEKQGMAVALAELEKAEKDSKEAKQHSGTIPEESSASVPRPSARRRACGDKLRSALDALASGGERHSVEFVRLAALAVIKHSEAH